MDNDGKETGKGELWCSACSDYAQPVACGGWVCYTTNTTILKHILVKGSNCVDVNIHDHECDFCHAPMVTRDWVVKEKPTCVKPGLEELRCTYEGCTVEKEPAETRNIPALNLEDLWGSWTDNGDGTRTRVCTFCGGKEPGHEQTESVKYTLTVHYQFPGGEQVFPTVTERHKAGEQYKILSKELYGYAAEKTVVEGKMPASDEVITVKYTPIEYTWTIRYVDESGKEIREPSVQKFTVETVKALEDAQSPEINGYEVYENQQVVARPSSDKLADKTDVVRYKALTWKWTINYVDEADHPVADPFVKEFTVADIGKLSAPQNPTVENYSVVSSTVEAPTELKDKADKVVYKADTYKLEITYVYSDNSKEDEVKTYELAVGTNYSYDTPPVEGYTFDVAKVNGEMPARDITAKVTYSPITYAVTYSWNGLPAAGTDLPDLPDKASSAAGKEIAVDTAFAAGSEITVGGRTYVFSGWTTGDAEIEDGKFTMPAKNVALSGQWTERTYTVIVHYVYATGGQAAPSVVRTGLATGVAYEVSSPVIAGFTASQATVSGTIRGGNVEVTVYYTSNGGTPDPTPVIPTPTPTPTTPGTTIIDEETPLGGTVGLDDTNHFAYIIGYEDGTVRPLANISRAEAVTIFFRLMTDDFRTANWSNQNDFSDVNAGDWHNNAISTCLKAGALEHFAQDASFLPNQAITRAEFASVAAGFISDEYTGEGVGDFSDTAGHWAAEDIRKAVQAGWITGDGNKFRPDEPITRAEVMTIINRMLDRVPDAEHMLPEMKVWSDNPKDAWYYADVQEATNEHAYERDEMGIMETWTELRQIRDWKALEEEWAESNSKPVEPVVPETEGGDE